MDIVERSRTKGSAYRAIVKGLPASASWQDLKARFSTASAYGRPNALHNAAPFITAMC